MMFWSAQSERQRLISYEIIFEVFHDISTSQTERRTDRRLAVASNTAFCVASRGKNSLTAVSILTYVHTCMHTLRNI